MKTRADSKISLRKTTRTSTQTGVKSKNNDTNITTCTKPKLRDIQESPRKTRKQISPSEKLKKEQDPKTLKCSIVTPKSKRGVEILDDRTPLKDEILFCSQQFDSQSGIGWGSNSPNSVRYVRLNKGNRKTTDVSDIVMQLVVPEDERHDDKDGIGTPPLLGIWMDSGAGNSEVVCQPYINTRASRRKAKSKLLNDGGSMTEWMEKLKLAMEKYNEDGSPKAGGSSKHTKNSSAVNITSKDNNGMLSEMNVSADLFVSADKQLLQTFTDEKGFLKKASPHVQNRLNKSMHKTDKDSDTSWSDDELFQDDSFIIKATQNPAVVIGSNIRQFINKRKSESDNPERPTAKNAKLDFQQSRSVKDIETLSDSNCDKKYSTADSRRQNYKMTENIEKDKGKISSPFRRYSSFNDSLSLKAKNSEKFGLKQNSSSCTFTSSNKPKLRKINSFSGPLTTSTPAKIMPPVPDRNTIKTMSPIIENNASTIISPTSDYSALKTVSPITEQNAEANIDVRQIKTNNNNVKLTQTFGNRNPHVQLCNNTKVHKSTMNLKHSDQLGTQTLNQKPFATSLNRNISSQTTNVVKNQSSIVQKSKSTLTSRFNDHVESEVSSVSSAKKQIINQLSPVDNSRRRSSGVFDSSLSDDLLCQLAEPDDLLESQVSPEVCKSAITSDCDKTTSTGVTHSTENMIIKSDRENFVSDSVVDGVKKVVNIPHNTQDGKTNKETIGSSQVGKYTFKSSKSKNPTFPKSAAPSKSESSSVISRHESKISRKDNLMDKMVINEQSNNKGDALCADSEDLFLSDDEDDALSEPQILAMLETVELLATQTSVKDRTAGETDKTRGQAPINTAMVQSPTKTELAVPDSPFKCTPEEINKKKQDALMKRQVSDFSLVQTSPINSSPSSSQSNKSESPFKCTPEDIERKKHEALQRRRQISGGNLPTHQINSSPSKSQSNKNVSPIKCTSEDIERKKQEALQRKRQVSGSISVVCNGVNSSPSNSQVDNTESPFKCSPEEIERKKLAALAKRKVLVGTGTCDSGGQSNCVSNQQILEEIERKKQAAIKRRRERLKSTQVSNSSTTNKLTYNPVNR